MRFLTVLVSMLILLAGCKNEKDAGKAFQVKVNYKNAAAQLVTLSKVPYTANTAPAVQDSVKIAAGDGSITLKGSGMEEGLYQLYFPASPMNLAPVALVNDAAEITIEIDFSKTPDDYLVIKGSPGSLANQDLQMKYFARFREMNNKRRKLDSLQASAAPDTLLARSQTELDGLIAGINSYLGNIIKESPSPVTAAMALSYASYTYQLDSFKNAVAATVTRFPTHGFVNAVKSRLDESLKRMAEAEKQSSAGNNKPAPEITLNDVDGKEVKLSSFRGKYVLIDFWASWCGPCRGENPNVVKAYNQFKDKNFTILGVSLDEDKGKWLQAIKADKLTWPHVSDLKGWSSAAAQAYGVNSIPANFLVDPEGKIIASNLRGGQLIATLTEKIR